MKRFSNKEFIDFTEKKFSGVDEWLARNNRKIWDDLMLQVRESAAKLPDDIEDVEREFFAGEIGINEMFWRLITSDPKPTLDEFHATCDEWDRVNQPCASGE